MDVDKIETSRWLSLAPILHHMFDHDLGMDFEQIWLLILPYLLMRVHWFSIPRLVRLHLQIWGPLQEFSVCSACLNVFVFHGVSFLFLCMFPRFVLFMFWGVWFWHKRRMRFALCFQGLFIFPTWLLQMVPDMHALFEHKSIHFLMGVLLEGPWIFSVDLDAFLLSFGTLLTPCWHVFGTLLSFSGTLAGLSRVP